MTKVFIIAEAGINHNGSVNIAKKMIDTAVIAGADAVKFQTFKTGAIACKNAPKADYQKQAAEQSETQFDMLKKLELDKTAHEKLIAYCREKRIIFLSTPFDLNSIDMLDNLGLQIFKISSGEITNLPYLRKIGALNRKIILSTGMSIIKEVKQALSILIQAGTLKEKITLLHCNTAYPAPYEDVNLQAMCTMKKIFDINVGYSDHTLGIEIPIAAAALGAVIIEKHFTLDKNMPGPDNKVSIEPDEFKTMVCCIRNIEKALGDGVKAPSPSELKNMAAARKSIVASCKINRGEVLSKENLAVKRPGTGISPMEWDSVIGTVAKKDFEIDELIK